MAAELGADLLVRRAGGTQVEREADRHQRAAANPTGRGSRDSRATGTNGSAMASSTIRRPSMNATAPGQS